MLHIGKYYSPIKGGIEDHLYNLCNDLKHYFDIRILVANNICKTEQDKADSVDITRVLKLGELSNIPFCPTMPIWLNNTFQDIVHIHWPNPMAHLAWFLARPKGKLIITYHSDIVGRDLFQKFYNPFFTSMLRQAERIIATSTSYIQHSPYLNRFEDKSIVIPLGIDLSKFALTKPIRENVSKIREKYGNRIILFVGRLSYYKGVEYLIRAMEHVEGNLIIVGKGNKENELKVLSKNSLQKDSISFIGEVPDEDITSFFHACDVFVLPSVERSEAFGIVQLEAMACGKPVISTDLTTGVPWVNKNGKTGIVVPPRDSVALSNALNTMLNNPGLCEEYGKYGMARVKKEFTSKMVAERVTKLYYDVMQI